jgi:hypothetical protein
VSIHDERELRDRLGGVLDTITPSPAPVSATVRQGKMIKVRRWASAAAGLAAVAVLAVVGPGLLHRTQAPVGPASYHVTVNPPGPHAPAGLIASGTINGRRWRLIASPPGAGNQCISGGTGNPCWANAPLPSAGKDPANFSSLGEGTVLYEYGAVRRDVTRLEVILGNGTVLTLHPVSLYGRRYVAFALPSRSAVTRIVAYSRHSELAFAVPFRAVIVAWHQPGARLLPRSTFRIGSGVTNGTAWSEFAYVGPWGRCFEGAGGGSICVAEYSSLLSPGQLTRNVLTSLGQGRPTALYYVAAAAPSVDHVRVTLSDGRSIMVQAHEVLGQKFYTFAGHVGVKVLSWTAYDAQGVPLGTGHGGFDS